MNIVGEIDNINQVSLNNNIARGATEVAVTKKMLNRKTKKSIERSAVTREELIEKDIKRHGGAGIRERLRLKYEARNLEHSKQLKINLVQKNFHEGYNILEESSKRHLDDFVKN